MKFIPLFHFLLQITEGSSEQKWKRVKNTEIEVMDFDGLFGKRKACGIAPVKKTPPRKSSLISINLK